MAATWSAATSPSTSTAPRSALFDDPIYAWAGGGYVSASTFQFYEHDAARGFVSGGHIAAAGVGIPLPINWRLPGSPTWGAEAKQIDRDYFNHRMAVAMVLHDMPQHDNRVDLDDEVVDAWGLPVARITLKPHENDLGQGRYLIDRSGDILEARRRHDASARSMPTAITGNCSHQHGTARMGDDPASRCSTDGAARTRSTTSTSSTAALPDRHRRQPDADHHGQRLAGRRQDHLHARECEVTA